MLSLGLWLSCQLKRLFSIALISCQEGKISKFPWMLWSMLITEKSINIKVNAISKSSVAKHYQKSLRIQEKWLPKPKSNEWTSLSINTFSGSLFWYHFFFNLILFNFTILYWFCHISKWIRHRYTCVPHPEPSSLPPPHTIPLGHPSAPAPSIQYRALILDWQLVFMLPHFLFRIKLWVKLESFQFSYLSYLVTFHIYPFLSVVFITD